MRFHLDLDSDDVRPLIERTVEETIRRIEADNAKIGGQLGYPEPEAAALLGLKPHVLRDCRLRGEISASKVGKRLIYTAEELKAFLRRMRAT